MTTMNRRMLLTSAAAVIVTGEGLSKMATVAVASTILPAPPQVGGLVGFNLDDMADVLEGHVSPEDVETVYFPATFGSARQVSKLFASIFGAKDTPAQNKRREWEYLTTLDYLSGTGRIKRVPDDFHRVWADMFGERVEAQWKDAVARTRRNLA